MTIDCGRDQWEKEMQDLAFQETDDACAMCGKRKSLTVHHIDGNSGRTDVRQPHRHV